jgi:hypothetical protein
MQHAMSTWRGNNNRGNRGGKIKEEEEYKGREDKEEQEERGGRGGRRKEDGENNAYEIKNASALLLCTTQSAHTFGHCQICYASGWTHIVSTAQRTTTESQMKFVHHRTLHHITSSAVLAQPAHNITMPTRTINHVDTYQYPPTHI